MQSPCLSSVWAGAFGGPSGIVIRPATCLRSTVLTVIAALRTLTTTATQEATRSITRQVAGPGCPSPLTVAVIGRTAVRKILDPVGPCSTGVTAGTAAVRLFRMGVGVAVGVPTNRATGTSLVLRILTSGRPSVRTARCTVGPRGPAAGPSAVGTVLTV